MPFTLSHTVASLLFIRAIRAGKLSATGLILGCMAPDFEYFLRMKMYGEWGHTAWGMLFLDLPIALLIALLFHRYIRDAVIRHAPTFLQTRLMPYYQCNWWHYFKHHVIAVLSSERPTRDPAISLMHLEEFIFIAPMLTQPSTKL